MKTKTIFNEQEAEIMFMREQVKFARARAVIKELKESNAPLYWDILWDGLRTGGDVIINRYMERFAQEHFLNINDFDTKGLLLKKFECLADPTYRYLFPQKFCYREDDGSFDVDIEKLRDYCRQQCTYTITEEQDQAIKDLLRSMKILGLVPFTVRSYFWSDKGEIKPLGFEIYKKLNGQASGRTEADRIEQKFNAIRQVSGLRDENAAYM